MNRNKLKSIARRATKVVADQGATGKMAVYLSGEAWAEGRVDAWVKTDIPEHLTPQEAKQLGWALFTLGKCAIDLSEDASEMYNFGD